MAESTITSEGQITIPKVVRERLHLEREFKALSSTGPIRSSVC